MKRTVKDVMTKHVVVVKDSAPYKKIVELMAEHRVSAIPVVDDDEVLRGVVSEADLVLKEEYGPDREPALLSVGAGRRAERKAGGRTAAQLMSAPAVTIRPDDPLGVAARRMHRHSVKRLPVVDETGRILGIVSRADLLRIFLQPDDQIRRDVAEGVFERVLSIPPSSVTVEVNDGVVILWGEVEQASMIPLVKELVEGVDGVVGVDVHLTYRLDDTRGRQVSPWGVFATGPRP